MSSSGPTLDESPQELLARIRPLFDAIDLNAIDDDSRGCIQAGELSGTDLCDDAKRLLVLNFRDVISIDELSTLYDLMVET